MAVCYIVGAAAYCAPFIPSAGDWVIAADGGLAHLQARGITPDRVVGDFDSLGTPPVGEGVLTFPVEKDDTDTMLAVRLAWEAGYREFRLLAGTGGRADHTLANLQILLWVARRGGRAVLCGEDECFATLQNGTARFLKTAAGNFSLFAQGGDAHGVTVQGAYYTLTDGILTAEHARGVSNHFTGKPCTVTVRDGAVLIYWQGTADEVTFDE
ncbi:MAG: thiamine diphosphokinase [Ruminococcaceae bacterium]|nr:thiamine diphosphokinase [Oscillospiraceae bacterium]